MKLAIKHLSHQYGRQWGGNLLANEVLDLAKAGAQFRKDDLVRVRDRLKAGEGGRMPIYFEVKSNSELEKLLQKGK